MAKNEILSIDQFKALFQSLSEDWGEASFRKHASCLLFNLLNDGEANPSFSSTIGYLEELFFPLSESDNPLPLEDFVSVLGAACDKEKGWGEPYLLRARLSFLYWFLVYEPNQSVDTIVSEKDVVKAMWELKKDLLAKWVAL